jgi:hypothetical protein
MGGAEEALYQYSVPLDGVPESGTSAVHINAHAGVLAACHLARAHGRVAAPLQRSANLGHFATLIRRACGAHMLIDRRYVGGWAGGWVGGRRGVAHALRENYTETLETFKRDGIVVLEQFCSPEEVARMKGRMAELIDKWDPAEAKGSVFHTYGNEKLNQDYFLESAATVKFFLEADAVHKDTGLVKGEIPKAEIINKVGHALHFLDPVFSEYSQSQKVKGLVKSLGYKDPVLPQSMYIFKQGKIGGEVTSHQDSTYLFTTPHQTCLGLWLALDDATVENGCLWARKGSHAEPIRSQLFRTDAAAAQLAADASGKTSQKSVYSIFDTVGVIGH